MEDEEDEVEDEEGEEEEEEEPSRPPSPKLLRFHIPYLPYLLVWYLAVEFQWSMWDLSGIFWFRVWYCHFLGLHLYF